MATFLDVSGLEYFSSFFVFIFVWLGIYAILAYSKIVQNKSISILIGLLIGVFVLFSPTATGAIQYIAPWFAVVLIFIMLAGLVIKSFGATDLEAYSSLRGVLLVIVVIVLVVGVLSYVREQTVVPGDNETSAEWDYKKTGTLLFHPKVLGMLFILLIAVFTIALLAGKQT